MASIKPSSIDQNMMAIHVKAHIRSRLVRIAEHVGARYNNKEHGWMMRKHTAALVVHLHEQGYDVINNDLTKVKEQEHGKEDR